MSVVKRTADDVDRVENRSGAREGHARDLVIFSSIRAEGWGFASWEINLKHVGRGLSERELRLSEGLTNLI